MDYVIIVLESHCNPVLKGCSRNMLLMYNAPSSLIAQKLVEIIRYNNKEYIVNQSTHKVEPIVSFLSQFAMLSSFAFHLLSAWCF